MNHHLRFPIKSALATTTAVITIALSSCTTTEAPPLAAIPDKEITYEIQFFDVPESHPFGDQNRQVLSPEKGAALIKSLKKKPTLFVTTGGKSGETKTLSNKRKFVYPSEYAPAKYPKPGTGVFPVTPATPTSFKTTQTGTTVSITGEKAAAGFNEIDLLIDRKILLGFTNYGTPITTEATDFFGRSVPVIITENRIEKPNFHTEIIETSVTLSEGSYFVIRNIGVTPVKRDDYPFTPRRPAGFIALIRAISR